MLQKFDILSRKDAKKLNLTRYFTGKSCKNGHVSERLVADYNCVDCTKLRRKHKKENGICRDCSNPAPFTIFCDECLTKVKWKNKLKLFGLTQQQYLSLLSKQHNKCAICKTIFTRKRPPCVDHNHKCCPTKTTCGKCIRKFLCSYCNSIIGYANDNIKTLERAIVYLKIHAT